MLRPRKEPVIDSSASSTNALFAPLTPPPTAAADQHCCTAAIETFYMAGMNLLEIVENFKQGPFKRLDMQQGTGGKGSKDLDEMG